MLAATAAVVSHSAEYVTLKIMIRVFAFLALTAFAAQAQPTGDAIKQGHSHYGKAFDEGPRAKPVEIDNIAKIHFPITHKNAEVQKWFDQGATLLHHFWDYEAERAFRWAWKLEPDNAMVYWGLARATGGDRSKEFIRQAVKRKATVTERERLYIESLAILEATSTLRDRDGNYEERNRNYRKVLETLCVKYPDDVEAKALLAYSQMGEDRYGVERIVREILEIQPNHPGGHHYRIHNWNGHEAEQALPSAARYGQLAPGSGHALHMPGHIYSTVGMWHEAAIAMDSATRVERRVMRDLNNFPFNHWNYGHNRNYLCYIEEQLGMADRAIFGAQQLIAAPLDPQSNSDNWYSSHSQGLFALLRALVKYERWAELLDKKTIPWRENVFADKLHKAYAEARGYLGQGKAFEAEKAVEDHAALKKEIDKNKQFERHQRIQSLELRARLHLLKGESLDGLTLLMQAAGQQAEMEEQDADPPKYPQHLYTVLGDVYREQQSPALAIKAYEKALKVAKNDIFSLSGLVQAHHALGHQKEAEDAMARLLFQAAGADKGLKLLERAQATGIKAKAKDSSPGPQRNYAQADLSRFGPNAWSPHEAARLEAVDKDKQPVTLENYRGKNVILVFYLGRECAHCLKQLKELNARKEDWARLDTVVLAVSGNTPETNAEVAQTHPGVTFLSDDNSTNAKRYQSYDDFEEMDVHSTVLIDKQGRVHWSRTGGAPFEDTAFLVKQLERMNNAKP